MDKELSSLSEQLAGKIKDQNKKKVAVLDFTDLEGSANGELGRYIAEQLTIDMVMEKRDFAVLDRANLKKILAEHKLTATGLVDPDNAKKLGQFAGVDALILGNIIPKGTNINLTAKIITTDTAEIVGAARAQFINDQSVQQLLSKPAIHEGMADASTAADPDRKIFGDLQAKVESLRVTTAGPRYSLAKLTLLITNTSETLTYGVAAVYGWNDTFHLSNDRGDEFQGTDLRGIEKFSQSNGGEVGKMTELPPKSGISVVFASQAYSEAKPGDYRPYRFQAEFGFGVQAKGRYSDARKYNLVLDIK